VNRSLYVLALVIVFSPPGVADEMSNVKVVKAMTEAINDRNLDALDAFVSPNLVRHSAATPGLNVTSLDEFRAFLETDFATIPDSVQTIDIKENGVAVHGHPQVRGRIDRRDLGRVG